VDNLMGFKKTFLAINNNKIKRTMAATALKTNLLLFFGIIG
jgi:hypothetical protein